jgi:hypothetical protein
MKRKLYIVLLIFLTQLVLAQNNKEANRYDVLDLTFSSGNITLYASHFQNIVSDTTKRTFMLEYICVDRINDVIKRRKLDFPISSFKKVITDDAALTLQTNIYFGSLEVPLEVYNPDSLKSFEKSPLKGKKHILQVCLLPRGGYNYSVILKNDVVDSKYLLSQSHTSFNFANGKKFKILLTANLGSSDNLIIPFLKKNVWKYVDEYIIISLEE